MVKSVGSRVQTRGGKGSDKDLGKDDRKRRVDRRPCFEGNESGGDITDQGGQ